MNDDLGLTEIIEYTQLRAQAVDLLDRCLTEGDEHSLLQFLEAQITHEPPRLALLRELADDLQLRLLSLKEYRFDVRDRIVHLFRDYGIDISSVAPPDSLDRYHLLTVAELMAPAEQPSHALAPKDVILLRKAVEASLITTAQLTEDIKLTAHLHRYVEDWISGLNAVESRRGSPFRKLRRRLRPVSAGASGTSRQSDCMKRKSKTSGKVAHRIPA